MKAILDTNYEFDNQVSVYKGKVRDVYTLEDNIMVMVTTDRVSAFDVVMPRGIPHKGQVLTQIAVKAMQETAKIVPNWMIASPDPNVIIGHKCTPFKVEMVIRGYLSGHAAREYKLGKRMLCGVYLPEGLKENDKLQEPIITPTTKADMGSHDQDISKDKILSKKIVSEEDYSQLEKYTKALFDYGSKMALQRGLILVDTKYEFGKTIDGNIVLIDEIHTPDSSRYFYADTYEISQNRGNPQRQLSKEFIRQWLIEKKFQGKEGQQIPEMSDNYILSVSDRYIELYEKILGSPFQKPSEANIKQRIEAHIRAYFKSLRHGHIPFKL